MINLNIDMKTNESRTDAVHVLINDKPVWLDLENLRDDQLAMRDESTGDYETESGEHHFSHQDAVKAAEKQGKRLLTSEEYKFLSSLPRRWDEEKKGFWFKFPTRKQFKGLLRFINPMINYLSVEVFFPAAGYRSRSTGALTNPGANGNYWSAAVTGTYAYYLYFYSGNIGPSNLSSRANGFSVRCVAV